MTRIRGVPAPGGGGSVPDDVVTSTTITTIVSLTQAEYDLLTPDDATLYVVVD